VVGAVFHRGRNGEEIRVWEETKDNLKGLLGFGSDSVRGGTPYGETSGDVFGIEDEAR
jgi:hypothetical protein